MKIGIDFGSTYSTFSTYNRAQDQLEVLLPVEGDPPSIPSVVSIAKSGKESVGTAAKAQAGKKTVRIFEAFKMLLTESNQEMLRARGYDDIYTPRRISKEFFESMLQGILKRTDETCFEEVFVCVPEIWSRNLFTLDGRSILRDILKNEVDVPVDHVQVVTEPEAASAFFAYNYEKVTKKSFNGHLLLIDFGGGTLDITLTEVISSGNGNMEIGYRASGGAGENHPDARGNGAIGSAGIAYMQDVVSRAIRECEALKDCQLTYTDPDFVAAVRDFESQLKSADRMQEIEDTFGSYGGYGDLDDILEDEPTEFICLEYDGEEVPVTYQQLYRSYKETIEGVVARELNKINPKVRECIGADPCSPRAGERDDFKIALVGGFSSFYLVKTQISELYHLAADEKIDKRTKNIVASKREQAISLGAALLAAGKVRQQRTARYSIGLYLVNPYGLHRLYYGIKYNQIVEPGKAYYLKIDEDKPDSPQNRITLGALQQNITNFAIGFSDHLNEGGLMALKPEMLQRLRKLPSEGFWNCGFSMDESEVVSFHLVPRPIAGLEDKNKEIVIPMESYAKMFHLTAVKEVRTQ